MIKQTPGRIYLADQHGLRTTPQSSRCSVFSFAGYADEQRPAVGRLLAFNEETLAPGQRVALRAPQATYAVLLPLTGEVEYTDELGHSAVVQVEEVQVSYLPAGATLELANPFEEESISLLHIWLRADAETETAPQTFGYTFGQLENALAEIAPNGAATVALPFALSLGRFAGRHEAEYCPQHAGSLFFCYVLAGAFEVEGRLLHAKDGLTLWETEAAELEALSNNALVVVLEVQP